MTSLTTTWHRARRTAEPRPRFTNLVRAEWTKLWSLRSTIWVLSGSGLAVVAANANGAYADYRNLPHYDAAAQAAFTPGWAAFDAFTSLAATLAILAMSCVGAISVVGEYSSGLIRTTFTAVPARGAVMAAKIVVVTGVTTVFGALVAGISFWVSQAILSGRHAGLSTAEPGALRLVVASALLAPLCTIIGMALGALIRTTAATIVTAILVLLVLPTAMNENRYWGAVLAHTLPRVAWGRLTEIQEGAGPSIVSPFPWSVGGAWTVYAAWAIASILITIISVQRRDQ
ncbi:ABC transporter permease [Dactylosporangium sp. NPDC005555]|uniref:ABC transporter permease n=1 Tax=Dactylosporangium sp. NPDC005555 TaxID=3154889 RepID=UPI0033A8A7AF